MISRSLMPWTIKVLDLILSYGFVNRHCTRLSGKYTNSVIAYRVTAVNCMWSVESLKIYQDQQRQKVSLSLVFLALLLAYFLHRLLIILSHSFKNLFWQWIFTQFYFHLYSVWRTGSRGVSKRSCCDATVVFNTLVISWRTGGKLVSDKVHFALSWCFIHCHP